MQSAIPSPTPQAGTDVPCSHLTAERSSATVGMDADDSLDYFAIQGERDHARLEENA